MIVPQFVKISRFAERFWVRVTHYEGVGRTFVGVVDNDLSCPPEFLKCGDKMVFLQDEILDTMEAPVS